MSVTVWVGLMRAVNVGGRKLSMKDVTRAVEAAGAKDVRTYLQSGNVVFGAPKAVAGSVAAALSEAAGFDVPVLLRTLPELVAVRDGQLLPGPETAWHVTFLETKPASAAVRGMDPAAYGADTFAIAGREVYLRTPDGYGRTKLTNALFERKLGVVATTRNWRTVCALCELGAES